MGFAGGSEVGLLVCSLEGSKVGAWEGNSVGSGEGTWTGKSDGAWLVIQVGVFVGPGLG